MQACRMSKDEGLSCGCQVGPPSCSSSMAACFYAFADCYFCCYCCWLFFYLCISFLSCSPKWLACTEVLAFDDFCCTLLRVNFFFPLFTYLDGFKIAVLALCVQVSEVLPFNCLNFLSWKKGIHFNCTYRYSHVRFRKWKITFIPLATPGGNLWACCTKPKWAPVQINVGIFHTFFSLHVLWRARWILSHLMAAYDTF